MTSHILLTGTHLTPTLALIDELKGRYRLTYIGQSKNLLNISLKPFSAPRFNRHNLISALKIPFKFPFAVVKAIIILKKLKPNLLISFGGFLALPVCFAARILKISIIIHEQTFGAGLTNRLTAKSADKIAISWPSSFKYFPKSKTILTGNPVRKEIIKAKSLKLKKRKLKTIYVTGGNQGSRVLNQAINQLLVKLLKHYRIIHQFGLSQTEISWLNQLQLKKTLPIKLQSRYLLKPWFEAKDQARNIASADLIISRAGANTVTELGYLEKRSVLVPLPFAQKNEQAVNAGYLKRLGLAVILPQSKLNPQSLSDAIDRALSLPRALKNKFPFDLVEQASINLAKIVREVLNEF